MPFYKLSVRSRAIHCASYIPVQKGNSFLELVLDAATEDTVASLETALAEVRLKQGHTIYTK